MNNYNQHASELEGQMQLEATREELALEGYERQTNKEQAKIDERMRQMEIQRANQLAALQRESDQSQNEAETIRKESLSFGGPSLFKYALILFMFAIPNDLIDVLELTGFLAILSWLISMFLSISSIMVVWLTDSELQRVKRHMGKISQYKKTAATKLTKVSARLIKFAPKNPVIKLMAGFLLEMIPFLSILPWSSICTLLAYNDERQTFKEAKKSAEESCGQVSETAEEMV